jgi:shikimate kinase
MQGLPPDRSRRRLDPGAPGTIVLIGMMGSGKSSVGRALARLTGWRYVDNDELVRAAAGRAAEDIDAADGEAALHAAEAQALQAALELPPPLIVGAAAWIVEHPPSVAALTRHPAVVYLRARAETLRARIGSGSGRRRDATDLAWLRHRAERREHAYQAAATLVIDTDGLPPTEVARRIADELGLRSRRQPEGRPSG